MKHLAAALILLYGGIVTFGTVVAIGVGNAYSGWGDGFTVRHTTSIASAWPCAVFFVASAFGPYLKRRKARLLLFVGAFVVLLAGFMASVRGDDRFFLTFCVLVLSMLVWIPLLIRLPDPSRSVESKLR